MQRRGGANGNLFPQPRVRETRMHLHVTHVIRSRLARIASYAGLAWISLRAESLGSITALRAWAWGLELYI
jgi:hypothetical protein